LIAVGLFTQAKNPEDIQKELTKQKRK